MVPQAEGEALIRVMTDEPAQQGLLVPMNCQKNSGIGDKNQHCHPAAKSERSLVENIAKVRDRCILSRETPLALRNSARQEIVDPKFRVPGVLVVCSALIARTWPQRVVPSSDVV